MHNMYHCYWDILRLDFEKHCLYLLVGHHNNNSTAGETSCPLRLKGKHVCIYLHGQRAKMSWKISAYLISAKTQYRASLMWITCYGLRSRQMSTQLNTWERFWSKVLDSALHHIKTPNEGISFKRILFVPPDGATKRSTEPKFVTHLYLSWYRDRYV